MQTSSCSAGSRGSASVYGYFSGTNPGTYDGTGVPASNWLIISTGYSTGPEGTTISRTWKATIKVNALNSGAVAAVWNHIFLTAPLVPNVCQTNFTGNSISINAPIYSIGNLCLSGNSEAIQENGQPIDLMVGGKLVYAGNSDTVGSSGSPITSGVVVGNCASTVGGTATACGGGSWKYYVKSTDTFISQDAPSLSASQIASDYSSFDPGPDHSCQSGNHPYAPLASSVFDNNGTQDDSAGTFELAAASSYACLSQSGAGTGELIWNAATNSLTIAGNIFIDGNLTISHNVYYSGTGLIEVAGTVTIQGNSTNICAENPCKTDSAHWQGASGNNSMLTLAALKSNSTSAISMVGNSDTFQGSLWGPPTSQMLLSGNSETINGPVSVGTFDITGNSPSLLPLPVIKNMPTGAPVPPNSGVTIGSPSYTS